MEKIQEQKYRRFQKLVQELNNERSQQDRSNKVKDTALPTLQVWRQYCYLYKFREDFRASSLHSWKYDHGCVCESV